MLDVQVSESSLRDARSRIEDRVGSVRTQVATDGGGRRSSGVGGNRLSRENAMSRQLLTKQIEQLDDIHDELQKIGTSGGVGGGGSGGGGGFLSGLGAASVAKKGSSVLGMLGSLLGGVSAGGAATVGGGLLAGFGGAAGLDHVRKNSSWSPVQDFMNRDKKTSVPDDFSMSDEEAVGLGRGAGMPSPGQVSEAFDIERPEWFKNPFKGWSLPESLSGLDWKNPLRDWSVPDALSLDWSNPMSDWQIPKSLSNGLNWTNPMQGWQMPKWLKNPLGNTKTGKNKGGPLIPGFQPEKGDWIPGDGPLLENGSRKNRAKGNRAAQVNVDVTPQVSLDGRNLEQTLSNALDSGFAKEVADQIQQDVTSQLGI